MPCTACGGSGRIVLLVTADPCEACAGSGQIWPFDGAQGWGGPQHEHTPAPLGYWRREHWLDGQGRLAGVREWLEPVEAAEPGDAETRGHGDAANSKS